MLLKLLIWFRLFSKYLRYYPPASEASREVANLTESVYNGRKKITSDPKMFMDPVSVKECMLSLKMKNSEGYDRIPQRCLVDGVDCLCVAFNGLLTYLT